MRNTILIFLNENNRDAAWIHNIHPVCLLLKKQYLLSLLKLPETLINMN